MHPDSQYQHLPRPVGALEHDYGDNVHILSQPYAMSLLTELCLERTTQPRFNQILEHLYEWLLTAVASRELATRQVDLPTRMSAFHPEGRYVGEEIDRAQKVVVASVARGGILPGSCWFNTLNHLLDPAGVRQDHIFMERKTDDDGQVIGVETSGSKIGGPVDDATVFIPDPMGATGGSMVETMRIYQEQVDGTPRRLVSIHLIVTPEFIQRVMTAVPDARIYAIRLDRGLSAPDVLDSRPGSRWSEERGLNGVQYIVPGAGGLGELMNNAWV
jgi:uracil phosphoribosyltransferase